MKPLTSKRSQLRHIVFLFIITLNLTLVSHAQSDEFWGMTRGGGTGNGVIFKTDNTGGAMTVVHNFSGTGGSFPEGSLTWFNGKLYGMTRTGGANNIGTIFELDPSTQPATFAKKIDFNGLNGAFPSGSLTVFNNELWGVTPNGNSSQTNGLVFKYNPVSNTLTTVYEFAPGNPVSASPIGDLIHLNGKLYGMTQSLTCIFEVNPVSGTVINRYNLTSSDGSWPYGSLTVFNNKLYGLTSLSGANSDGTIFEYDPSSNPGVFSVLASFDQDLTGANPRGSITVFNNKFYGMTELGGANFPGGVIFEYDPAKLPEERLTKLFDFGGIVGERPFGSLLLYNGKFYGLTRLGGDENDGTLFEFVLPNNYTVKSPNLLTGGSPFYTTLIVAPTGACTELLWYRDNDQDTYGDPGNVLSACTQPQGYVANNSDCNDTDAAINPAAAEVCDRLDNNCNSFVDEGLPTTPFYKDFDGDGYGNPSVSIQRCSQPDGYVTNNTDCNDNNAAVNPGAAEVCGNNIDDNCNGSTDEGCNAITVSINNVSAYENSGVASLTISLSNPSSQNIKVNYQTIDGTAVSKGKNKDFMSSKSSVTIPAGQLSVPVSITIYNDGISESTEFFTVQISLAKNVSGVSIGQADGQVQILDGVAPALTESGAKANTEKRSTPEIKALSVKATPNPYKTNFSLVIQSPVSGMAKIEFFTLNGQRVFEINKPVSATTTNLIPYHGTLRFNSLAYKVTIGKNIVTGIVIKPN